MNRVHRTAVVERGVELGDGNVIGPYAVLAGPCVLGDDNWVGPHAVVGTPAQVLGGPHPPVDADQDAPAGTGVRIGSGVVLREGATVQQGTRSVTVVGDGAYVMAGAHVNHDAEVGAGVVLSNGVVLAGHVWVGPRANLGMGAVVHQYGVVGAGAMVGMAAAVRRSVQPYSVVVGAPSRFVRVNHRAVSALGLDDDVLDHVLSTLAEHLAGRGAPPTELAEDFAAYSARTAALG